MPDRRTAAPATTDQATSRNLESELEAEQEKRSWLDLSLAQVVGGALAAMTAAALGSRFSVTGTVVGAALASVITAVSGALYTASLRRSRETVRAVIGGRQIDAARIDGPANQLQPVPSAPAAVAAWPDAVERAAKASRRRKLIVSSVVGALAAFALAAGALTAYEALTGHALSGGDGTTVSQVQHGGSKNRPTKEKAPAPSESADPSATAEPSGQPSVIPQGEASPTAEPTAEPSPEPSAETSVTPERQPSATASQSSTPPRQTHPPTR